MDPQEPRHRIDSALSALNGLAIAVKTYRLYGNASQPGFDRALELIERAVLAGPLFMRVARSHFELEANEETIDSESFQTLAADLFDRGVVDIRIRSAPEPAELASFAALLAADIEEVESEGGPKAFLDRRGVVSFAVTGRRLEVADAARATPEAIELSRRIRELLTDPRQLAVQIESGSTPLEAYQRLQGVLDEGVAMNVERGELDGGLADTIAAMSERFRAELVKIAVEKLSVDELATMIVGQLAEGELTDAFVSIAGESGIEDALHGAARVAESARGSRSELPLIVARRIVESGNSRDPVVEALRSLSMRLGLEADDPGGGLRLEDAESELDLAELRGEARDLGTSTDIEVGATTLRALLRNADRDQDFEELVDFAEQSVLLWSRANAHSNSLAILEVMVSEAENHPDAVRRERLERAARSAVSAEMVEKIMQMPAGEANPVARRLLDILRGRGIPALLDQLARETDRGRRKLLVDMLVEVGASDISLFFPSLHDDRWYFVRNLATVLGRIHMPETVPHLIRLCSHQDPRVRREALRGAAANGGIAAIPALTRALDDPDEGTRLAAIGGLGTVNSRDAAQLLMSTASARARSLRERKEALSSLGLHANPEARGFLRRTAQKKWPPTALTHQLAQHAAGVIARPPRRGDLS